MPLKKVLGGPKFGPDENPVTKGLLPPSRYLALICVHLRYLQSGGRCFALICVNCCLVAVALR